MTIRLLSGDCRDVLPTLPAESVQCVVTSPPYYGLRDYGTALWDGGDAACGHVAGMARNDVTPERLAERAAQYGTGTGNGSKVGAIQFRDTCGKCGAVRVDRQIGLEATPDAYLATMVGVFREVRRVLRRDGTCWVNMGDSYNANQGSGWTPTGGHNGQPSPKVSSGGLAAKQLLLMPARLALALQADGWWIRSAITWCKANPMPESAKDRCTSATEMIYMLTKAPKYYFDQDAIRTESGANARNWWLFSTEAFPSAHFATYPTELAERCIKAGTRPGDTVLDPFAGAGTTLLVADRLQRDCIGIELNTAYTEMAMERCRADAPLFTSFPPAEPPEDERMGDLFAGDEYERPAPSPKPLQVPRGWDTGPGAHGTIHRTGRTISEAAD